MSNDEKRKRSFKNFFKTAQLTSNYHKKLIYVGFIFMSAINIYFIYLVQQLSKRVTTILADDPESVIYIFSAIKKILLVCSAGFFIFFIFMVLFILIIQFKVAGPTKAILKFIYELKNGNYDYVRPLRFGDELGSIMDSLIDLQKDMKKKSTK